MRVIRAMATFLLMLSLTVGAVGERAAIQEMKVTIPFRFVIQQTTFASGDYFIFSSLDKIWVQDLSGRNVALIFTGAAEGKVPLRDGRVVFACYVEECFLSQVWIAGREAGQMVPKSKRQTQLASTDGARQFSLLGTKPHR